MHPSECLGEESQKEEMVGAKALSLARSKLGRGGCGMGQVMQSLCSLERPWL